MQAIRNTSDLRPRRLRGIRVAAVASLALAGLATAGPATAVTVSVTDPCDVQVVPVGDGVPGDPQVIEAAPGTVLSLAADATCVPLIGAIVDGVTGLTVQGLAAGDGITLAAPGVTFDLNGHSITSATDIASKGDQLGLDVENAGVAVGAAGVTVTNSSLAAASTVSNFTANFDFGKGSNGSSLRGQKLADGTSNLRGGDAHGGGVLAIDRTQNLTIDGVQLVDAASDLASLAGDNAVDWKRCTGTTGRLTNSVLQAPLTGVRLRGCTAGGLVLSGNTITSPGGTGVEVTRDVKGATITGNTISNNGADGVAVRAANEAISITGNVIQNNLGAGISVSPLAKTITTSPNNFLNNALGNVVIG
jgi:parallel beta-helix repeat protein